MIYVLSAHANKCVQIQNKRNFFQAMLDSDINSCFRLNEHGDLYFLPHNNSVHIVLFSLENSKKISEGKTT